jgi:hypothetical protein
MIYFATSLCSNIVSTFGIFRDLRNLFLVHFSRFHIECRGELRIHFAEALS